MFAHTHSLPSLIASSILLTFMAAQVNRFSWSPHNTPHYIKLSPTKSLYNIVLGHITSSHIMSSYIISYHIGHVTLCHIVTYHIILCHIVTYHIISYCIIWHCIMTRQWSFQCPTRHTVQQSAATVRGISLSRWAEKKVQNNAFLPGTTHILFSYLWYSFVVILLLYHFFVNSLQLHWNYLYVTSFLLRSDCKFAYS